MKKITTTVLLILICQLSVLSQVTLEINSSNNPNQLINQSWTERIVYNLTLPQVTGINVTWDYHGLDLSDTISSITAMPSNNCYLYDSFPNSESAWYYTNTNTSMGNKFVFYQLDTTNQKYIEMGLSYPVGGYYLRKMASFKSPFHYGDNFIDSIEAKMYLNGSFSQEIISNEVSYVAAGTLILPFDTFLNVVLTRRITGNPFWIYTWYATTPIIRPIMIGSAEFGGTQMNLSVYVWEKATKQESSIFSDFELYPNPAQDEIHLSFSQKLAKNVLFCLRDLQGRVVFTQTLREGSEDFVLEIGDLAKGMYFWEARAEGKLLQTGKLLRE